MEHRHKLLATASCQPQGACRVDTVDRFSNLPDEIAHRILSLVNFKDLVSVGRVSKRGKDYYLSTPSLKISLYTEGMLNVFERFLIHRRHNKIEYLSVEVWLTERNALFRVITWIHIAIMCNVEVLDLQQRVGRQLDLMLDLLDLSSCIFRCGSLRSLSLCIPAIVKMPSSASSNNLQHLNLRDVEVDEGFFQWISSCGKYIKELQLFNVRSKNITIESSSLESFTFVARLEDHISLNISCEKLEDIYIDWYAFGSIISLNIFAPNLKKLKWSGNFLNHQNLGNLMCLENAEILLEPNFLVNGGYDSDSVFEVLCSICRVKVLILNDQTIKAMFREDSVHVLFNDISFFCMNIMSMSDDLVPAMVSLLRRMPNLNTLKIIKGYILNDKPPKACKFNRKYWESKKLDFVFQLKEVKIELSNGYNGMELAKYILEHARSLKKMVIVYQTHQSYVRKKVNNCKKVSNATVVFHESKN